MPAYHRCLGTATTTFV